MKKVSSDPNTNCSLPATEKHHCLIGGGGLSRLMAATVLRENDIRVTILDKGRIYHI